MKPRLLAALVLGGLVVAGMIAATSALAAGLGRDALRSVVAACVVAKSTLNLSFPCSDIQLDMPGADGFALLRSPGFDSEFLVTTLAPLDGIGSPELQAAAATGIWDRAWAARSDVAAALGRPLGRTDVALAVNGVAARTQDHFHIHVDCVRQSVDQALTAKAGKISERWSKFPGKLIRDTYWVRSISGDSLKGTNVAQLIADSPQAANAPLDKATIAVVGATLADGSDGFYILANWSNGSAERLLDHRCQGR